VDVPDVSYAQSGDVSIAYQAVGEGPPDLVFLPFLANIYTLWQAPHFAEFGRRLATGRRLGVAIISRSSQPPSTRNGPTTRST
jgi:hypothetical protein